MTTFQKIFKNGGHFGFFEFSPKMRKHKNASISLTVRDRAISSKYLTPRVSKKYIWQLFKKFSKVAAILNFQIFTKNASISLTVRDRAISSKFLTPRVCKKHIWQLFKKFLKMVAILNFWIFAKNAKTQKCFYLLNR